MYEILQYYIKNGQYIYKCMYNSIKRLQPLTPYNDKKAVSDMSQTNSAKTNLSMLVWLILEKMAMHAKDRNQKRHC